MEKMQEYFLKSTRTKEETEMNNTVEEISRINETEE